MNNASGSKQFAEHQGDLTPGHYPFSNYPLSIFEC